MQFHPTTLVDSTLLLSEALRGEGAVLLDEGGPPLHRRARAARRRGAGDRGARDGAPRPARDRPRTLPDAHGLARAVGLRPGGDADSGRAGGPLHGRRHRHRPRRPLRRRGPLRRRRVRCDRRPRREPARVELAARVPRLRPPRRARRAGRADAPTPPRALGDAARPGAGDAGAPAIALAGLRAGSRRRRARATPHGAAPPHTARRGERARPRGEPRLTLPRRLPGRERPFERHVVLRHGAPPELETWR